MEKETILKPDSVLKDYWRNNDRFADLFNQVFFHGADSIIPENLTDSDAEESAVILENEKITSLSRTRDLIKQYGNGAELVLTAVENQMKVHYAMPVRSMLYDALRYMRQCKALEQAHRKKKDLKGADEFLSGIAKADKISPIVNLIIYYGENEWDGPVSLRDMSEIPPLFQPFYNNYNIHLLQVKDAGRYHFKNQDNNDFFQLIEEFYNSGGKINLKAFKEKYKERYVYWETLAALGAATGSMELVKYAREYEGGRINMCTALENLKKEGLQEGLRKGIVETIGILQELNITDEIIIQKIQERYGLSPEEAQEFLQKGGD